MKPTIFSLIHLKKIFCGLVLLMAFDLSHAQRDIIFKNDNTRLRCKIVRESALKYEFAYANANRRFIKGSILKKMVDSVKFNFFDTDLVKSKNISKNNTLKKLPEESNKISEKWKFSFSAGLNLGNILEFNSASGNDKKSFSATSSIDLGLNYQKEGRRFEMTIEMHWLFGLQKSGIKSKDHIQMLSDDLNSLHDFSFGFGRNNKWNFNLIARTASSVTTIYKGDFFKDFDTLGKAQGFLSPYDITFSPGIKWKPNKSMRISISPYSFNLYGVKNEEILNAGIFITEQDAKGKYKSFLFKRLGAEINFWYDRNIKNWMTMQYRVGISSDYFEKIAKNGLLDGLFITRIKLLKNLFVTHRAILKGDLAGNPLKPFYSQSILLSYAKHF
jgi:hypothetical protein